jgi:hypothetical protein
MRAIKFTRTVYVQDRSFEVRGTYTPGFVGNWDNPPECADIYIRSTNQLFENPDELPWNEDEEAGHVDIEEFVDYYFDEFYNAVVNSIEEEYDERGGDSEND